MWRGSSWPIHTPSWWPTGNCWILSDRQSQPMCTNSGPTGLHWILSYFYLGRQSWSNSVGHKSWKGVNVGKGSLRMWDNRCKRKETRGWELTEYSIDMHEIVKEHLVKKYWFITFEFRKTRSFISLCLIYGLRLIEHSLAYNELEK